MNLLTETVQFPNLFSGEIPINPIAFKIGDFGVYWYGILIAIGVILGFAYALKRAKKVGLISDNVFDVAFISTIFAFIGARAYFCIFATNGKSYNIITMFTEIHDGGLAIYGGLIAGIATAFIACKIKKMRMLPLLDLASAGFLIGQGIGRWGNFLNQECFGTPNAENLPWGMTGSVISKYPEVIEAQGKLGADTTALVHPCFLYEFLWCVIGFLIIHFIINKIRSFDGECFLFYVFWYGAGRAWIEGLRTDSLYIGSFRVSQLVAIISAVLALILYVFLKIYLRKRPGYQMYVDTDVSAQRLITYRKNIEFKKHEKEAKKAMRATEKTKSEAAPSVLSEGKKDTEEKTEKTNESENDNG